MLSCFRLQLLVQMLGCMDNHVYFSKIKVMLQIIELKKLFWLFCFFFSIIDPRKGTVKII